MSDMDVDEMTATPRMPGGAMPRFDTPLVPRNSISGRALIAVVAIMTFLASLTTGAVLLVASAASEWQSDVAREVTVQIIPAPGRDLDAAVDKAAAAARAFPGIGDVRAYSKEESSKLLEPWLGSGLKLDELPVPRLIVVKIAVGAAPDLSQLRKVLAEQVPGATLDDHRGWIDRMRTMAGSAVAAGVGILILVIAATMLSVTFATRGAMASNKPVIEVLHFVGGAPRCLALARSRQAEDGGFALAMINENLVASAHFPDRAKGLGITHSVPDGLMIAGQIVNGIGLWIGFGQEVVHGSISGIVQRRLKAKKAAGIRFSYSPKNCLVIP